MARNFIEGNAEYFNLPTAGYTYDVSMGVHFLDDNGANNDREMVQYCDASSPNHFMRLERAPEVANLISLHKRGGSGDQADGVTAYSLNVWNNFVAKYTPTTASEGWLNGLSDVISNQNVSPNTANMDAFVVGAEIQSDTADDYWDGDLAGVARWDATTITDEEALSFGLYFDPILIRPENLVHYLPMLEPSGPLLDLVGGDIAVEFGTPNEANHPPMLMVEEDQQFFQPAGAPSNAIAATPDLILSVAADLAARGAVDATPDLALTVSADLDAPGALDAAPALVFALSPDLAGAAGIDANVAMVFAAIADLRATGNMDAAAALAFAVAADLRAIGQVDAAAALVFSVGADLLAAEANAIAAAPALAFSLAADLLARGDLDAAAAMTFTLLPDLVGATADGMAATPALAFALVADMQARGALDATAALVFGMAANLTGRGTLDASPALVVSVAADLEAEGALLANPLMAFTLVPDLVAADNNSMQAAPAMSFNVNANLLARGTMLASALLQFDLFATLADSGAIQFPNSVQALLASLFNSFQALTAIRVNSRQNLSP